MIYFYKLSDELVRVSTTEQPKLVLVRSYDNKKEEGWLATLGNLMAHYCERTGKKSIWENYKYVAKKVNISSIINIVEAYLKEREKDVKPFKFNAGTYKMKYAQKIEKGEDIEYKVSDILQSNAIKFWELKEGISTAAFNRFLEDSDDKDSQILELGKKISREKIPFKEGYPTIFNSNEVPEAKKASDIYVFNDKGTISFSSKRPDNPYFTIEGIGTQFEEFFGSLTKADASTFSAFMDNLDK